MAKIVQHFCSNLLRFTGGKARAYERALAAPGILSVEDNRGCAWTVITVEEGSRADDLLKPLSMHRKEQP
jgi:hypothetical protein